MSAREEIRPLLAPEERQAPCFPPGDLDNPFNWDMARRCMIDSRANSSLAED